MIPYLSLFLSLSLLLLVNLSYANGKEICVSTKALYGQLSEYECVPSQGKETPLADKVRSLTRKKKNIEQICQASVNPDRCEHDAYFGLQPEALGLSNGLKLSKKSKGVCYMIRESKGAVLFYLKSFLTENCQGQ